MSDIKSPIHSASLKDSKKELSPLLNSDFYSLTEANEYLNKKYNHHLFTNSFLLKQLISYKIPTHIYGFGLTTFGSEFIFKNDLLPRNKKINGIYDDDLIKADLSNYLREEAKKTGLFLELRHQDLVQIYIQNQVITHAFQDVIPFDYANKAINLREAIDEMWKATVSFSTDKEAHKLIKELHDRAYYLFDNFVSVEQVLNTTDTQNFLKKQQYLNIKPQIFETNKETNLLGDFCFFKIISEDIFILNRNLALFEDYLTGGKTYEQNIIPPFFNVTKSPKGKSKNKEMAQFAAKTLANYLWNQDKDKKIKIKEMAITIHAELNQTEHSEQLPDQSISLKKWIEDVAPEYAREAGRTKENI